MATAAGSTHPTGMHSCLLYFLFVVNCDMTDELFEVSQISQNSAAISFKAGLN